MKHNAQEIIRFIRQLVRTPSQNSIDSEQAISRLVFSKLQSFGFDPKIIGNDGHPSVVCEIKKNPGGKMIWLEAPLDTAPIGDLTHWEHPPCEGKIIENIMYGRGVADAKAAIAIFSYLSRDLIKDSQFKGSIFLSFDADEQSGNFLGIKESIQYSPHQVDACILGYQCYNEIMIGARGWLRLRLTTKGKAAHTGSRKGTGINAIHAMAKAVAALSSLEIGNKKEPFFEFGSSLHVSKIHGGIAVNVVPDRCMADIDIRLVPSQTKEDILERIENLLQNLKKKERLQQYSIEVLQHNPAFLTDPKEMIVHLLHKNIRKATGKNVPFTASGAGSVGNILHSMNIPIVDAFGCDSGKVHAYNEWLDISTIPNVFEIYKKTLIEFSQA